MSCGPRSIVGQKSSMLGHPSGEKAPVAFEHMRNPLLRKIAAEGNSGVRTAWLANESADDSP